jgi:PAS domain-containing protein
MATATAVDEAQRVEALRRYQILDTRAEPAFDNLARLAAHVCGTSSSIICFVDETRSWTKAGVNNGMLEVPREGSAAALVVALRESVVVSDTRKAPSEIRALEAVADHGVRCLAAVPLLSPDGHAIGAIGAFDRRPRPFGAQQLDALERLAQQVMASLELRRQTHELREAKAALEQEVAQRRTAEAALARGERRLRALVENGSDIVTVLDPDGTVTFVSPSVERFLGYTPRTCSGGTSLGSSTRRTWNVSPRCSWNDSGGPASASRRSSASARATAPGVTSRRPARTPGRAPRCRA